MKCEQCDREIEKGMRFCSYECACYSGEFSVKDGWIKKEISLAENIKEIIDYE